MAREREFNFPSKFSLVFCVTRTASGQDKKERGKKKKKGVRFRTLEAALEEPGNSFWLVVSLLDGHGCSVGPRCTRVDKPLLC